MVREDVKTGTVYVAFDNVLINEQQLRYY